MAKKKAKQEDPPDEEAKGFVEMQMLRENEAKIDVLHKNVSAIRQLTSGISRQIGEDDQVISALQGGFDRSRDLVRKTLTRFDTVLEKASGSMWTYVLLFVLVISGLAYKLLR